MDFGFDMISDEEYERQRALYGPLTESLRRLIEAGLHTEVDEGVVRDAQDRIDELTQLLESKQRTVTALREEATGRPLAWANPAVGLRNAIAPPMVIHHEDDGQCWSEFTLGRRLRGTAGMGARRHLRPGTGPPPRRGGQRGADPAEVHRNDLIAVSAWDPAGAPAGGGRSWSEPTGSRRSPVATSRMPNGPTVEAEGVFIMPAWARDAG